MALPPHQRVELGALYPVWRRNNYPQWSGTRPTTGMAVGPEIAQAEPAPIGTMAVRTKVPGGVDLTGPPVRRGHGVGRYRRGRLGMRGISFTQGTMGLVRQPLKRCGLGGAVARGFERLGLGWRGRNRHRALGPGEMQNDEKPDEYDQD